MNENIEVILIAEKEIQIQNTESGMVCRYESIEEAQEDLVLILEGDDMSGWDESLDATLYTDKHRYNDQGYEINDGGLNWLIYEEVILETKLFFENHSINVILDETRGDYSIIKDGAIVHNHEPSKIDAYVYAYNYLIN